MATDYGRRVRIDRRTWLKTMVSAVLAAGSPVARDAPRGGRIPTSLSFKEISHGLDRDLHVAPGYSAQTVLRWGDSLFADTPGLDVNRQSAQRQARQFGYNNDYVAYLPVPSAAGVQRGVMVVNHEFTMPELMFPGGPGHKSLDKSRVDIEIAAQGLSVVELTSRGDGWRPVLSSSYNRRITPWTPMRFSGPAAGHHRLRTTRWRDGINSHGTFANCAGGVTPWGTVLSAEENIDYYFSGNAAATEEAGNYRRFGFTGAHQRYPWGHFYDRWNLDREPRAAMHAGWIVEIDPFDRNSVPIKRTALGRFRHENCAVHVNRDGRVVAYLGDDQRGEYIYRFVSDGKFMPDQPAANRDLLDHGTLSVARFADDGRLVWMPLQVGIGPLVPANGFASPADIALDTRAAADLVGATPMDRPEEVDVNPVTGSVFVLMTGNYKRLPGQTDAVNPRVFNRFGHVLELFAPEQDHAAPEFRWEIFLLAGDPDNVLHGARYHPQVSKNGWLSGPDNCAFDARGRLWITTDGSTFSGFANGIWAADVRGPGRALTRHFMRAPVGAEVSGPCFTPDQKTLFCAIQHPGAARGSSFDRPATRWPDFDPVLPPRPAVIAVTKDDGGSIGD